MSQTKAIHEGSDRRAFLAAAFAAVASVPAIALQQGAPPAIPPEQPRDSCGEVPVRYPDPDMVALDTRFRRYIIGNTTIKRLSSGAQWSEGPAWCGGGRYLVWRAI